MASCPYALASCDVTEAYMRRCALFVVANMVVRDRLGMNARGRCGVMYRKCLLRWKFHIPAPQRVNGSSKVVIGCRQSLAV